MLSTDMRASCAFCEKYQRVLVHFDRNTIDQQGDWEQIELPNDILKNVNINSNEYIHMPIIIYDDKVSPLLHSQVFSILSMLNSEKLYENSCGLKKE